MLNHIFCMGRLTADPEMRHTTQGTAVATFTLAVDRDYQQGGSEKQTDFITCVAWRQTAEFVSKYFAKGRMAIVSGRLQGRRWETDKGDKRICWEVVADRVYFGDSKKESKAVDVTPPELHEITDDDGTLPF